MYTFDGETKWKLFMTVAIVALLYLVHVTCGTKWCDRNQTRHGEGLVGERSTFPWLGVLRVHIHDGNTFSVAVTGMLLVRESYAVAGAHDVSRLPRRRITDDGKAMFIIKDYEQRFCGVLEVTVHPDYEATTYHTIALLRLHNCSDIPAICMSWQSSTSNLFAMGYTDRNKLLEKVVYKINYVNRSLCEEYYNRVGYKQPFDEQEYVCGAAPTNTAHCEWDSGMVLASNQTGYWTLAGFGVRGPGCAAPARFVSPRRFLPWVDTIIDLDAAKYNKYIHY